VAISSEKLAVPKEQTIHSRYVCSDVFYILVPLIFQGCNEGLNTLAERRAMFVCIYRFSKCDVTDFLLLSWKMPKDINRTTTVCCHCDIFTVILFFIFRVIALSWSAKSWRVKKLKFKGIT